MRWTFALPLLLVAAAPADRAGPSRADHRLKADVLRALQRYSVAACRGARLGQVQAQSLPRHFRSGSPVYRRGGHWEEWSARVCGQRRSFLVAMWPRRHGGVDFTLQPRTGVSTRR